MLLVSGAVIILTQFMVLTNASTVSGSGFKFQLVVMICLCRIGNSDAVGIKWELLIEYSDEVGSNGNFVLKIAVRSLENGYFVLNTVMQLIEISISY